MTYNKIRFLSLGAFIVLWWHLGAFHRIDLSSVKEFLNGVL